MTISTKKGLKVLETYKIIMIYKIKEIDNLT